MKLTPSICAFALLSFPTPIVLQTQVGDGPQGERQTNPPTFGNISYGSHERHLMDVWLAESKESAPVLVSIHGGGFTHGNKSIGGELREACLKAGISLWLAFHDDLADPGNDDPVLRQSTRLTCAAVSNAQTSYDPRFIRKLFPEDDQVYRIGALRKLFDADLDQLDQLPKEKYALFEAVSPINHLTKDDVPVLLTYLVKDSEKGAGIHSPKFGYTLKKEMDKLGIRSEVVTHIDRDDPRYAPLLLDFIKKEFGIK